ncbi:MAG: rhodanese-like domain-containing protein [Gammaproteobacteria bacterium]|nr:rhodanese-like domain-containing protein [Gammaproteobacteria bacterium]
MQRFRDLVAASLEQIEELFPWDLEDRLTEEPELLLLDVREPYEFDAMHIEGALNVPRGILETACEYGFEETVPRLVESRDQDVIVICRSGNRSALAAAVMKQMGYRNPISLKTGMRGWSDSEMPMVDAQGQPVDQDAADAFFEPRVRAEQLAPADRDSR